MGTFAVTGGAAGIGAAVAARLGADGHRVVTVDLGHADVVADLGTPAGRAGAIAEVLERSGGALTGVVTCAGLGPLPSRDGALLVSVNHFGTVEVLEGLRPALVAGGGAAVAIASNATTIYPGVHEDLVELCLAGDEAGARERAHELGAMASVYPASKIAVARWVRRQATTGGWIGSGVRLNAVAPGMVETAMTREGRDDPTVGPLMAEFPVPQGRGAQPEEVAAVIAFLLGPEASILCGSVVFADGGSDALLRPDDWPAAWHPARR